MTDATNKTPALIASRIVVRHVVAGPVEAASSDGTRLTIAGQVVVVSPSTRGTAENPRGTWRQVSGLRDLDGTIIANRIDPRPPGAVVVSGVLLRRAGVWRIGGLVVRDVPSSTIPGSRVFARGNYTPNGLTRPTLTAAPTLPFGDTMRRFSIEAYVRGNPSGVVLGDDLIAPLGQGVAAPSALGVLAVIDMQRSQTGLEVRGIRGVGDTHAQGSISLATTAPATPAKAASVTAAPAVAPPGVALPGVAPPGVGLGATAKSTSTAAPASTSTSTSSKSTATTSTAATSAAAKGASATGTAAGAASGGTSGSTAGTASGASRQK